MPRRFTADPGFADELRRMRHERGLSLRDLAGLAYVAKSTIGDLENGRKSPTPETAHALDRVLRAGGRLTDMVSEAVEFSEADADDEEAALELARRIAASDVRAETMAQLEAAVDDLATAYPKTPPADLLARVRRHLGYVSRPCSTLGRPSPSTGG